MTESNDGSDQQPAIPAQLAELRYVAGPDEDIPDGMRVAEVRQRLTELRSAG